jgi:hypothetical protein
MRPKASCLALMAVDAEFYKTGDEQSQKRGHGVRDIHHDTLAGQSARAQTATHIRL